MKVGKTGILWFRQDLRLHDNEALSDALHQCERIIPVYVFDERVINGKSKFGFPKIGIHRLNFLLESILDLKSNLQKKGSDLIIRFGKPEEEIFKIARIEKTSYVFCNRERTDEEVKVQDALEKKLWTVGQEVRYSRGKMLFYTADLPFPITHTPDVFSHFKKEIDKFIPIRAPLSTEEELLPGLEIRIEKGTIPDLKDLGFEDYSNNESPFRGGETAGLKHLEDYFFKNELPESSKFSGKESTGIGISTKFSAWLNHGCISPKRIYEELKKNENQNVQKDSLKTIYFQLMLRDFYRLMGKKHGNNIFKKAGIKNEINSEWVQDKKLFRLWAEGRTGIPFIDANMSELNETGYMSYRGRQNVASFLIHDLKMNWQMGAEYFESQLIDYDPCSNYGNWISIAGIGNDPKEKRKFNTLSQAYRYDPECKYIKSRIPVLRKIPSEKAHNPRELTEREQVQYNFILGKDYPASILTIS